MATSVEQHSRTDDNALLLCGRSYGILFRGGTDREGGQDAGN
jgi:hypothetical protein